MLSEFGAQAIQHYLIFDLKLDFQNRKSITFLIVLLDYGFELVSHIHGLAILTNLNLSGTGTCIIRNYLDPTQSLTQMRAIPFLTRHIYYPL